MTSLLILWGYGRPASARAARLALCSWPNGRTRTGDVSSPFMLLSLRITADFSRRGTAPLQRIATESETSGPQPPRSYPTTDSQAPRHTEIHWKQRYSVASGPRGRWLESTRPDQFLSSSLASLLLHKPKSPPPDEGGGLFHRGHGWWAG